MKKTIKSILSVLFAAAMIVNFIPVYVGATEATATPAPTAAATDAAATEATATPAPTPYVAPSEFTALVMYAAEKGDWAVFDAREGINAVPFYGDGVYEVTIKGSDIGATAQAANPQVFLIDMVGFATAMDSIGVKYQNYSDDKNAHDQALHNQPTDLTIKVKAFVDGQEIRVKNDMLNCGNIEEKGTFRIEIRNIWGLHNAANVENPAVIAEAICPESEIKVIWTIQGTGFNTEAGAAQIAAANPTPTTAPVASETTDSSTASTTETAASSTTDSTDGGNNTGLIIGIVAAVVVVAVVVIVLISKKKKK